LAWAGLLVAGLLAALAGCSGAEEARRAQARAEADSVARADSLAARRADSLANPCAYLPPPDTARWALDVRSVEALRTQETDDEPYVLAIGFRSTFGEAGATQVVGPQGFGFDDLDRIDPGEQAIVDDAFGRIPFPDVRHLRATDPRAACAPADLLGAVMLVMEHDLSTAESVRDVLAPRLEVVRAQVARVVEAQPLARRLDERLRFRRDVRRALTEARRRVALGLGEALTALFTSVLNPDDYVGAHALFVLPVERPDAPAADALPSSDATATFGVLPLPPTDTARADPPARLADTGRQDATGRGDGRVSGTFRVEGVEGAVYRVAYRFVPLRRSARR
jgi:hypothetical protein